MSEWRALMSRISYQELQKHNGTDSSSCTINCANWLPNRSAPARFSVCFPSAFPSSHHLTLSSLHPCQCFPTRSVSSFLLLFPRLCHFIQFRLSGTNLCKLNEMSSSLFPVYARKETIEAKFVLFFSSLVPSWVWYKKWLFTWGWWDLLELL